MKLNRWKSATLEAFSVLQPQLNYFANLGGLQFSVTVEFSPQFAIATVGVRVTVTVNDLTKPI